MSVKAVEICEKYDIHFIFLPSNSTHLLQPLDVAVFASFKKSWRCVLEEWKHDEGQNKPSIPKGRFPTLMNQMLQKIGDERMRDNIQSGFRKCGIFPFDPSVVYARLPPGSCSTTVNEDSINDTLINYLRTVRFSTQNTSSRKKKLNVAPGKSVSREDLLGSQQELSPQPGPSHIGIQSTNDTARKSSQSVASNIDFHRKRRGRPRKQTTASSADIHNPSHETSSQVEVCKTTNRVHGRSKTQPSTHPVVPRRRNARRSCRTDPIVESDDSEPFPASDTD